SEEHTSELQSRENLVCRLLLEKKKNVYLSEPGGFSMHVLNLFNVFKHISLHFANKHCVSGISSFLYLFCPSVLGTNSNTTTKLYIKLCNLNTNVHGCIVKYR